MNSNELNAGNSTADDLNDPLFQQVLDLIPAPEDIYEQLHDEMMEIDFFPEAQQDQTIGVDVPEDETTDNNLRNDIVPQTIDPRVLLLPTGAIDPSTNTEQELLTVTSNQESQEQGINQGFLSDEQFAAIIAANLEVVGEEEFAAILAADDLTQEDIPMLDLTWLPGWEDLDFTNADERFPLPDNWWEMPIEELLAIPPTDAVQNMDAILTDADFNPYTVPTTDAVLTDAQLTDAPLINAALNTDAVLNADVVQDTDAVLITEATLNTEAVLTEAVFVDADFNTAPVSSVPEPEADTTTEPASATSALRAVRANPQPVRSQDRAVPAGQLGWVHTDTINLDECEQDGDYLFPILDRFHVATTGYNTEGRLTITELRILTEVVNNYRRQRNFTRAEMMDIISRRTHQQSHQVPITTRNFSELVDEAVRALPRRTRRALLTNIRLRYFVEPANEHLAATALARAIAAWQGRGPANTVPAETASTANPPSAPAANLPSAPAANPPSAPAVIPSPSPADVLSHQSFASPYPVVPGHFWTYQYDGPES